jgi:hypothetical protein
MAAAAACRQANVIPSMSGAVTIEAAALPSGRFGA